VIKAEVVVLGVSFFEIPLNLFNGHDEERVLLVQKFKAACTCNLKANASHHAPEIVSDVLNRKISPLKISEAIESSFASGRKLLISGDGVYIQTVCAILSEIFCEKLLKFTTEKI